VYYVIRAQLKSSLSSLQKQRNKKRKQVNQVQASEELSRRNVLGLKLIHHWCCNPGLVDCDCSCVDHSKEWALSNVMVIFDNCMHFSSLSTSNTQGALSNMPIDKTRNSWLVPWVVPSAHIPVLDTTYRCTTKWGVYKLLWWVIRQQMGKCTGGIIVQQTSLKAMLFFKIIPLNWFSTSFVKTADYWVFLSSTCRLLGFAICNWHDWGWFYFNRPGLVPWLLYLYCQTQSTLVSAWITRFPLTIQPKL